MDPDPDLHRSEGIAGSWDAGPMGCGELVLELSVLLRRLPSGALFRLRALDPGAPEDLPEDRRIGVGVVNQKSGRVETLEEVLARASEILRRRHRA